MLRICLPPTFCLLSLLLTVLISLSAGSLHVEATMTTSSSRNISFSQLAIREKKKKFYRSSYKITRGMKSILDHLFIPEPVSEVEEYRMVGQTEVIWISLGQSMWWGTEYQDWPGRGCVAIPEPITVVGG